MANRPSLCSNRILIVENEIAIALELEARLSDAGFETIGPALNAAEAVCLIAKARIDAAVLDLGVIGSSVEDVMRPLLEQHIPCLFMSGYSDFRLPEWVPAAERFSKPFSISELVDRIRATLHGRALA